jgi:hypothetical protein
VRPPAGLAFHRPWEQEWTGGEEETVLNNTQQQRLCFPDASSTWSMTREIRGNQQPNKHEYQYNVVQLIKPEKG